MRPKLTIDAVGMFCPMPIILTQQKIKELENGEILEIVADDDGIKEDMPKWCIDNGHELLQIIEDEGNFKVFIKKQ